MSESLVDAFCWFDQEKRDHEGLSAAEKYKKLVGWAMRARGQNPCAFDALTDWILDDAQWRDEIFADNEKVLMQAIFARFIEQNAQLRVLLLELEPSGVVNPAVFKALDRFDEALSGFSHDKQIQAAVAKVFDDFSVMRDRGIREMIAGNRTGPTGTDSVDLFGYINCLKDYDAGIQWALFMPDVVKQQQQGFSVESFEYRKMPAMRFIGQEGVELDHLDARHNLFGNLDAMSEYHSAFGFDVFLMHHNGLGVDVGPWHGVWGRFMHADTPVPEGFLSVDFVPDHDSRPGPPYLSQFAYATFSGDMEAMHRREGYDSDAMYDVTRNIMLGQGVQIPYPDKYWTAEVFLEGFDQYSTAFLFSAEL